MVRGIWDRSAEAYQPGRVPQGMVRGALLVLCLGLLMTVPSVAAGGGLQDATAFSGVDCIGRAGGDDYVEVEDYPGGGFRVFVGAPIGALADAFSDDLPGSWPGGSGWTGVGAYVGGPGCEVTAMLAATSAQSASSCIGLVTEGDWVVDYENYPGGGYEVFVGVPDPADPGGYTGIGVYLLGPDC